MRKSILKALLLTALVMMAACASGASEGENGNNENENLHEGNGAAEEPGETEDNNGSESSGDTVTFTDDLNNEVEIPVNPERVVTTQYTEVMLALDFPPAGATAHTIDAGYLEGMVENIENIGQATEVNFEVILELEPDLIIAHQYSADFYEQLSEIAPTVLIDTQKRDLQEQIRYIGGILGQHDEAEEWLDAYQQLADEAIEEINAHINEDETVGLYIPFEKGTVQAFTGNVSYAIYESLRLPVPEKIEEEMEADRDMEGLPISLEVFSDYAADHMFVIVFDRDNYDEIEEDIFDSSLWTNLPAYENDQIYIVDADVWFQAEPLSLELKIEEAVEFLTGDKNNNE